jgi:DNA-binding response OmpR family regulator
MDRPATILIVDDERPIAELVAGYLHRDGFRVVRAYDGPTAVDVARAEAPDLLVLDLMLPGFDGLEVIRQLRVFSDAYVIMLTARTEEIDRIVGLTAGADDYVTKPFSPRELVARVKAMLRRPRNGLGGSAPQQAFHAGGLVIDEATREVMVDGQSVNLTKLEFDLLATLAAHPGIVFSRNQLLDRVWGDDFFGDEHVVDVHLSNLRHKLEPDSNGHRWIETVRGVGYRLRKPAS